MRQNLANRLAGGGVWALLLGQTAVESVRFMRDNNVPNLAVTLTDRQVLGYATAYAFNLFLNVNMDSAALQVQTEWAADEPASTYADKYGWPITHEEWIKLHHNDAYRQIDLWRNGLEAVFT